MHVQTVRLYFFAFTQCSFELNVILQLFTFSPFNSCFSRVDDVGVVMFVVPQINTVPMRSQVGYVDVVFPPQILVDETSSDVVAGEGSNVTLACRARGYPTPQIQWKREDKREIPMQTTHGKTYGGK